MANSEVQESLFKGSIHRFSNGYGRGLRLKTERNMMTLPPSIPKYRYPPEDDPGYFKSTQKITGDKAYKRLADQVVHQESGQWGSFLLMHQPTAPSVNYKKLRNHQRGYHEVKEDKQFPQQRHSQVQHQHNMPQQTTPFTSARDQVGTSYNIGTNSVDVCLKGSESARKEVYAHSLNNLDPAFRRSRSDLIASILPNRPVNEQRWAASRNVLAAGATAVWSSSLRY